MEIKAEGRGKKYAVYKAMKKKKTLLRLSTKQGLKLCDFVFNKR